jgi:hypothetical protein
MSKKKKKKDKQDRHPTRLTPLILTIRSVLVIKSPALVCLAVVPYPGKNPRVRATGAIHIRNLSYHSRFQLPHLTREPQLSTIPCRSSTSLFGFRAFFPAGKLLTKSLSAQRLILAVYPTSNGLFLKPHCCQQLPSCVISLFLNNFPIFGI